MNPYQLHKILGLVLVLPLMAWIITGAVFILKPGYGGAYEQLTVKTYPIEQALHVDLYLPASKQWREVRRLNTILGGHLLVLEGDQWQQLELPSPQSPTLQSLTLAKRTAPTEQELRRLFEDAISLNPDRYGHRVIINDGDPTGTIQAITETNITLSLDWPSLSIRQSGSDTKLINTLYQIHYLQWFGKSTISEYFAIVSLCLLLVLVVLGLVIYGKRRKTNHQIPR